MIRRTHTYITWESDWKIIRTKNTEGADVKKKRSANKTKHKSVVQANVCSESSVRATTETTDGCMCVRSSTRTCLSQRRHQPTDESKGRWCIHLPLVCYANTQRNPITNKHQRDFHNKLGETLPPPSLFTLVVVSNGNTPSPQITPAKTIETRRCVTSNVSKHHLSRFSTN